MGNVTKEQQLITYMIKTYMEVADSVSIRYKLTILIQPRSTGYTWRVNKLGKGCRILE